MGHVELLEVCIRPLIPIFILALKYEALSAPLGACLCSSMYGLWATSQEIVLFGQLLSHYSSGVVITQHVGLHLKLHGLLTCAFLWYRQ